MLRRFAALGTSAALLVALLAGCSGTGPGGPGATGSGSPALSATAADALLPADQMPAWNEATQWAEAPEGQGYVLALCRLPEVSTSVDRAERRYTSDTLTGVNTVTEFADADSAAEAARALMVGASNCVPPDLTDPPPRPAT